MSDLFDKLEAVRRAVATFDDGGPMPFDTMIEACHGPTTVTIGGRRTACFGSNNYLGLTHHPRVVRAASEAPAVWGVGTTGSRVANGTYASHRAIESALAKAFAKKHALVFTTGHHANQSILSGLCGTGDTVIVDAESHASIFDGARLSGATVIAFRHNDPDDLERKLGRLPPRQTNRLVVIEGLYSTSGDVAPVAAITRAAHRYGAYLAVDEAHSFGVLGERGLGAAEAEGALEQVDFVVGTFSKSLGGVGGFAISNHDALRWLHFCARAYLFTASSAPATIAAALAALDVVAIEPELRTRLRDNAARWRGGLRDLDLIVGGDERAPIVPVTIGAPVSAVELWRALLEQGIYVNLVLPPGCAHARSGLRTSVSAAHTEREIDDALGKVARALENV